LDGGHVARVDDVDPAARDDAHVARQERRHLAPGTDALVVGGESSSGHSSSFLPALFLMRV
jgi:NAD(P)H-dependent flavin oxidoreductase YrpB (nitropropane dioxygenase family)